LDLAGRKVENQQDQLWDWVDDRPLVKMEQTRPFVGDFYEEATKAWLGAFRLRTEAFKLCPDLAMDPDLHLEVKSVGNSKSRIIYEHRREKYDRFMADGAKLYYVFWFHNCEAAKNASLFGLRAKLAARTQWVIVAPGKLVHDVLLDCPVRMISYSIDKTDPEKKWYKRAARTIGGANWRKLMAGQSQMAFVGPVYGNTMPAVPAYVTATRQHRRLFV
jgi:hypothetical protein